MMRVAEDGLGLGDYLPDFALEDGAGRTWTSSELLDRGPLVLALFRGDWCPYCDLTMAALEEARPAIEALGAMAVGIMPDRREHVARTASRKAGELLAAWDVARSKLVKVVPTDYRRALEVLGAPAVNGVASRLRPSAPYVPTGKYVPASAGGRTVVHG